MAIYKLVPVQMRIVTVSRHSGSSNRIKLVRGSAREPEAEAAEVTLAVAVQADTGPDTFQVRCPGARCQHEPEVTGPGRFRVYMCQARSGACSRHDSELALGPAELDIGGRPSDLRRPGGQPPQLEAGRRRS